MRERDVQVSIRMSENEKKVLERNAQKCKLGISEYIRMLIKGYVPREAPTEEFIKLCREIATLNSLLMNGNQTDSAAKLRKIFLELKAVALLPERIN